MGWLPKDMLVCPTMLLYSDLHGLYSFWTFCSGRIFHICLYFLLLKIFVYNLYFFHDVHWWQWILVTKLSNGQQWVWTTCLTKTLSTWRQGGWKPAELEDEDAGEQKSNHVGLSGSASVASAPPDAAPDAPVIQASPPDVAAADDKDNSTIQGCLEVWYFLMFFTYLTFDFWHTFGYFWLPSGFRRSNF